MACWLLGCSAVALLAAAGTLDLVDKKWGGPFQKKRSSATEEPRFKDVVRSLDASITFHASRQGGNEATVFCVAPENQAAIENAMGIFLRPDTEGRPTFSSDDGAIPLALHYILEAVFGANFYQDFTLSELLPPIVKNESGKYGRIEQELS